MYHNSSQDPLHNLNGQNNDSNPDQVSSEQVNPSPYYSPYQEDIYDDEPPPPPPDDDEEEEQPHINEDSLKVDEDELYAEYNAINSDEESISQEEELTLQDESNKTLQDSQQATQFEVVTDEKEDHATLFFELDIDESELVTPSEPFQITFVASPTVRLKLTCEPGSSALELLADSMLELLDHVAQDGFMTSDLVCGNNEIIENISIISESLYIRKCLTKGITPYVWLKPDELLEEQADVDIDIAQGIDVMTTFGAPTISSELTASYGNMSNVAQNTEALNNSMNMSIGNSSFGLNTFGSSGLISTPTSTYGSSTPKIRSSQGQLIASEKVDKRKTLYMGLKSGLALPSSDGQMNILLQLPDDIMLNLSVLKSLTIKSLKDTIIAHVKEHKGIDLGSPEKYLLKSPGASFLNNENEQIISLPYVKNCIVRGSSPIFIFLDKSSETAKRIKRNNLEIGSLIGRPLSWVQQDDEITSFRQSMARLRYFERQARAQTNSPELNTLPTRHSAPMETSNKTLVQLVLQLLQVKKTVIAFPDDTAEDFIQKYYQKYYEKIAPGKTFVLKVVGLEEYIYGNIPFHAFDYVKEKLAKNVPIELVLVEKPQFESNEHDDELLEDESFLLEDPTIKYDHHEIYLNKKKAPDMACFSVWDIHRKFSFKMIGIENISPFSKSFTTISGNAPACDECNLYMYITAELYLGGERLDGPWVSQSVLSSSNPRWCETASFNINVSDLPRATRICFTAYASKRRKPSDLDAPLAWVNFLVFNYKHEMRTGSQELDMWLNEKANPIGTCVQSDLKNPPTLYIEMDTYSLPVVFPTEAITPPVYPTPSTVVDREQEQLEKIWNSDPLYRMTLRDKQLMWKYREFCKNVPKALPRFLVSVPKTNRFAVQEMYRLLDIWSPIKPIDALELLDAKYADAKIRAYAVRRLAELSNEEILDYLLQLVQALKYEPYHDTDFARFLLKKALSSKVIGHHFFWYLKSEVHVHEISERFGLLLEAYLRGCGNHRVNLARQCGLQQRLLSIANEIKVLRDSERLGYIHKELKEFTIPFKEGISIPLEPRIMISGFHPEKCKFMSSKKLPLWLVFKNVDPTGQNPYVIFKAGDDLRQDMLTLQLIRIMDHLWKHEGLDLKMIPYGCISTGNEVGMIEVVGNSSTTASITKKATAAFREDPIALWLRDNNRHEVDYRKAVENFIYSCAGYCVATYVLGIGDRHNDNIMLTKDGRLFHIDFGHFLGNYKKKFGVKRERAPFVFTPDFAYVMGGKDSPDFIRFLDLCCNAYNILRKHSSIFINLFAMMLSTGIPELQTSDDIEYLRDAFSLDYTEQQATEKFKELVYESLNTRTTQINNAIHILVRG